VDALDLTAATVGAGAIRLHLAKADPSLPARFEVTLTTPGCATVRLEWSTDRDASALTGCKRGQLRVLPPGRFDGDDVVLALPISYWPTWLPSGTSLSHLEVQTTANLDVVIGAVWPPGDHAAGDVATVLR
jgi:hypothetical protein